MKTKSIMYFNRGNKCLIRLIVSIYSLREYWFDDIYVVCEGKQEKLLYEALKDLDIKYIEVDSITKHQSLCSKPMLYKYSKTDLTMYLDSDTLVLGNVDDFFDYIEEYDFVTTHFANWKTDAGGHITKRIKAWEKVCDKKIIEDAIKYGPAVNTGVNGWKKEAELLRHWYPLTVKGQENNCTTRIVDEIACQLLLPQYKSFVAPIHYNVSVKFGTLTNDSKIVHFHGGKAVDQFPACKLWKDKYRELVKRGILDPNQPFADRRLRHAPFRKQLIWNV